MSSTSELDELFQILNSIKGFKLNNHKGATQQQLGKVDMGKSDYDSLYPWTDVNHMYLVDTYKWFLVSFQCKFLSIQEVVELFHFPDSS